LADQVGQTDLVNIIPTVPLRFFHFHRPLRQAQSSSSYFIFISCPFDFVFSLLRPPLMPLRSHYINPSLRNKKKSRKTEEEDEEQSRVTHRPG
jgi:hypothetical protein